MTITQTELTELAASIKNAADAIKSAKSMSDQVSASNASKAIDWQNIDPSLLDEDGTFVGLEFTPDDAFNALGSIDNFRFYYDGSNQVPLSPWGTNLEIIANPITR